MYLYIEIWKAKDAWWRLSLDERRAKMDQLRRAAEANPIPGVIPFSFRQVGGVYLFDGSTTQPVVIDDAVARPTGFRYAAAWMIPTRELISQFERRVEDLGWWFDYFEQKNAWGILDARATLADMIGIQPGALSVGSAAPPGLGRFARAEYAVSKLRDDIDELRRGVSVVVDYVNTEKRKGN